jgi:hypothetical protein
MNSLTLDLDLGYLLSDLGISLEKLGALRICHRFQVLELISPWFHCQWGVLLCSRSSEMDIVRV